MLIKSKIFYRKTLKTAHKFHILLQLLGDFRSPQRRRAIEALEARAPLRRCGDSG